MKPRYATGWQNALAAHHQSGDACVLVTIIETRGSSPRDANTKMLVSPRGVYDTIGGGRLEQQATEFATGMLANRDTGIHMEEFALGPKFNQCCGGVVKLLFEFFPGCDFNVQLYGAGHVGRAMVQILGGLDCRVRWIDNREGMFPDSIPENVSCITSTAVGAEVDDASENAWHLVLTHDHGLDLEICDAVLSRGSFSYCGLIGSRSKSTRFRKRLAEKGFSAEELQRLVCPIGMPGLSGKRPMEIALSVVADLQQRRLAQVKPENSGVRLVK